MKTAYLFPHRLKSLGWFLFILGTFLGLAHLLSGWEPDFLTVDVPIVTLENWKMGIHWSSKQSGLFSDTENNLANEIAAFLIIVGGLLVAFCRIKDEDELIHAIRLKSLVWAVYINYAILLVAFLAIYDVGFFWVMVFNMFTILYFFIIRFHWKLWKLNKSLIYEK